MQWLIGIKGPKVCQENIPHTITRQPPGWLGPWIYAVGAKFWPDHLHASVEIKIHQTRPRFSSLQLSSFGEPVPTAASAFCSWLTEVESNVALCCCSPSTSTFDMLCILRFFSAHHSCTVWLSSVVTVAFLSGWTSLAILHWPLLSAELVFTRCFFIFRILSKF